MDEKIKIDGDEITQALEDVRERYAAVPMSQSEKSHKAVLEDIRSMLRKHPGMENRQIALEVGATPKQVAAQRYLMSDKGKAQKQAQREREAAAREKAAPVMETVKRTVRAEAAEATIDEILRLWQQTVGAKMVRSKLHMELGEDGCRISVEYRRAE